MLFGIVFALAMHLFGQHSEHTVTAQPHMLHCSTHMKQYHGPQAERTCESFPRTGHEYTYPDDFKYPSTHVWYTCPTSKLRVVVSNGIPNHNIIRWNPNTPCETPWHVAIPLNGTFVTQLSEPGAADIVGVQLNGVPLFGPQELEGQNAVEGKGVTDAQYWYGHTSPKGNWHYHSPMAGSGSETPPDEHTHLGYALDGFPLYGNLKDTSVLDSCNGRKVNGQYQYHVRTKEQVKGLGPMCNGTSPAILWNYIFGCFHGDMTRTKVGSSRTMPIPSDCVKDEILNKKGHLHTYNTHQYGHRRF